MSDLFSPDEKIIPLDSPLSARMRPRSLEEFVGQKHILGEGKLLTRAIEADRIASLILYGPPGCRQDHPGVVHLAENPIAF